MVSRHVRGTEEDKDITAAVTRWPGFLAGFRRRDFFAVAIGWSALTEQRAKPVEVKHAPKW